MFTNKPISACTKNTRRIHLVHKGYVNKAFKFNSRFKKKLILNILAVSAMSIFQFAMFILTDTT